MKTPVKRNRKLSDYEDETRNSDCLAKVFVSQKKEPISKSIQRSLDFAGEEKDTSTCTNFLSLRNGFVKGKIEHEINTSFQYKSEEIK